MLFILMAAFAAGLAAVALTISTSLVMTLVATPIVGSVVALAAALYLARRRGPEWQQQANPDDQAEPTLAILRRLAEQKQAVSVDPTVPAETTEASTQAAKSPSRASTR